MVDIDRLGPPLHAALTNLLIATAPFRRPGNRTPEEIAGLNEAWELSHMALHRAGIEDVPVDFAALHALVAGTLDKPLEELAAEGDRERSEKPGYRRDLDG